MQVKWIFVLLILQLTFWLTGGASSAISRVKIQALSGYPATQLSQNSSNHVEGESNRKCSAADLTFQSISVSPNSNLLTAIYFPGYAKSGASNETVLRKKHWNLASGREIDLPFNVPLEISEPSKGFRTNFTKLYLLHIIAFTPDTKILISVYYDAVYGDAISKLWKADTGEEIRDFRVDFDPDDKYISSLALAPDGKTLIWDGINSKGKVEKIILWDIETGKTIRSYDLQSLEIDNTFSLSPEVEILASISAPGNRPIKVFDLSTRKELRSLAGYGDAYNLALDGDGKTVFMGNMDGLIAIRDIVTGKQIQILKGHTARVSFLTLNPDKNTLLTGGWDGTVRLWDISTSKAIRTFCVE